jgi:hypothetical protein
MAGLSVRLRQDCGGLMIAGRGVMQMKQAITLRVAIVFLFGLQKQVLDASSKNKSHHPHFADDGLFHLSG